MDEAPRTGTTPVRPAADDDWRGTPDTAASHPGSAVAWFGFMALLVGGFALMGASFARGEGLLFGAGLLASTLAFLVPLELLGRRER